MHKRLNLILILTLMVVSVSQAQMNGYATAIFAGGCFWCMEADFEKLPGVVDVVSGYTGGKVENPSYEQVATGGTGHLEAVKLTYDPKVIDYPRLLDYFWRHIDPTRNDGQFCDAGAQYRPAIFYQSARQQKLAEASLKKIEHTKPFPDKLRVERLSAGPFYPAEDYHQDYSTKNPIRYRFYRYRCGRDERIEQLWGKA